jgi:rubrerythrin
MNPRELQQEKSIDSAQQLKGTAIERYLEYAEKAREQGYECIAQLFEEMYREFKKEV